MRITSLYFFASSSMRVISSSSSFLRFRTSSPNSWMPPLSSSWSFVTCPLSTSWRPVRVLAFFRAARSSSIFFCRSACFFFFHSRNTSGVTSGPFSSAGRRRSASSFAATSMSFSSSAFFPRLRSSWRRNSRSVFRRYPCGSVWRYLHCFPSGHFQNHPYWRFSTASRKNLHTMAVGRLKFFSLPCFWSMTSRS